MRRTDTLQTDGAESGSLCALGGGANDRFDVLADQRRRYVLSYLHDADDDVAELAELVDAVRSREAEREDGQGGGGRSDGDRSDGDRSGDGRSEADRSDAVKIELHHTHLPKLAASGVIDYDARTETVRYHGHPEHERIGALVDEQGGELRDN